jgi:hypothetical protein
MKKLGKLTISPEKIMKNEELINLQGGYDDHDRCGTCTYQYGTVGCVRNTGGGCNCPVGLQYKCSGH